MFLFLWVSCVFKITCHRAWDIKLWSLVYSGSCWFQVCLSIFNVYSVFTPVWSQGMKRKDEQMACTMEQKRKLYEGFLRINHWTTAGRWPVKMIWRLRLEPHPLKTLHRNELAWGKLNSFFGLLRPCRWRQQATPKYRQLQTNIHDVMSQKFWSSV
jgi:hypothetical protein